MDDGMKGQAEGWEEMGKDVCEVENNTRARAREACLEGFDGSRSRRRRGRITTSTSYRRDISYQFVSGTKNQEEEKGRKAR